MEDLIYLLGEILIKAILALLVFLLCLLIDVFIPLWAIKIFFFLVGGFTFAYLSD